MGFKPNLEGYQANMIDQDIIGAIGRPAVETEMLEAHPFVQPSATISEAAAAAPTNLNENRKLTDSARNLARAYWRLTPIGSKVIELSNLVTFN